LTESDRESGEASIAAEFARPELGGLYESPQGDASFLWVGAV
jgi:hypothetical protein